MSHSSIKCGKSAVSYPYALLKVFGRALKPTCPEPSIVSVKQHPPTFGLTKQEKGSGGSRPVSPCRASLPPRIVLVSPTIVDGHLIAATACAAITTSISMATLPIIIVVAHVQVLQKGFTLSLDPNSPAESFRAERR